MASPPEQRRFSYGRTLSQPRPTCLLRIDERLSAIGEGCHPLFTQTGDAVAPAAAKTAAKAYQALREQGMATTKDYGLGEFTFPRGWFMIGESAKITSTPQGVRFFGQDFALYRGKQSGKVYLLDAYCPHMGTHLAKNSTSYVAQDGAVEGDSIRCPYHAWRFGPDGKCNHIPYSKGPIPPQARVKSWRVEERMGAVFVWHDPDRPGAGLRGADDSGTRQGQLGAPGL
jgi:nitrite reductase/ring-hydroxylating ferredoxin subunit